MIETATNTALQAGASIEFLVGLDMHTTEPAALQTLYQHSVDNPKVGLYCYASLKAGAIYHPKLYLFKRKDEVTAIIGSSNLTEGGLRRNIEVNVLMEANLAEEVISDTYSTYNLLKFHEKRVAPDADFLDLYAELCDREKKHQLSVKQDKYSREAVKAFNEKVKTLQRPVPTSKDLVGWLKLVYEALPNGEFTNQEIYNMKMLLKKNILTTRTSRLKFDSSYRCFAR